MSLVRKLKIGLVLLVVGVVLGGIGGIFLFDITITNSSVTHYSLDNAMSSDSSTPVVVLENEFNFNIELETVNYDYSEALFDIQLSSINGILDSRSVTIDNVESTLSGGTDDLHIWYIYIFEGSMVDKIVYEIRLQYMETIAVYEVVPGDDGDQGSGETVVSYESVEADLFYYFMFIAEEDTNWFMENALYLFNLSIIYPVAFYLLPIACILIIVGFITVGVKYRQYRQEIY